VADINSSPVDLCIIAVVDDAIATVSEDLAASTALHSDALVFHTSGMRTSAALHALAAAGVHAGSIHPIQSFADPLGFTDTTGIGCGIEGTDAFCEKAFALATSFGWKPLRIDAGQKALYHAACVFAGNFPTVLAAHADELLRSASGSASASTLPMLLPMMQTVIARLQDASPADALTGPAARGQAEVVREHLSLLSTRHPTLAASYRALSESAAMIAASDNAARIKPGQTDHDPIPSRSRNPGDDDEV
jgi:predicted short-subunit dehydrogenase-like oxidoreductase (DUF2520 family)